MRVLLIKTSSMGDVIHALPALTDAMRAIPEIRFDWVVEEAFQEIPAWHPAVDRVIPVALRRWRKNPLKAIFSGEWKHFKRELRQRDYDFVLDSQGLIKSAWLASKAKGLRAGYDKEGAREPIASWFYQKRIAVDTEQHAIVRQRLLFAGTFGYDVPDSEPDSALTLKWKPDTNRPYVFFLHGTSWPSKEWPEENWIQLVKLAIREGHQVKLTWGNQREKERAQRIALATGSTVIPRTDLTTIADELASATRVVGVDSGFAHLAAAIGVPAVTLYGATNPSKTGVFGQRQTVIVGEAKCSPCMTRECAYSRQYCWDTLHPTDIWGM
jgi:heptosyltransferase-1